MNIFEKTDFTGDKPSVVSIKKSEKVNLFTVGLSEKQVLAKHITTVPATLVLLRGKVGFNISGETVVLREGDVYEIPRKCRTRSGRKRYRKCILNCKRVIKLNQFDQNFWNSRWDFRKLFQLTAETFNFF